MKSCLSVFKQGLSDLQQYIKGLDLEAKLILPEGKGEKSIVLENQLKHFFEHRNTNRALKRRFDYNSIIVSMYGLVEQYIKALMQDYLESLQKIVPSYSGLPEPITKNHVAVSFELIKQTEHSRYRGTNTKEKIISKLNSCLNEPENYKLNFDAFCQHNANFRSDVIDDFFKKVGFPKIMEKSLGNPNIRRLLNALELDELHEHLEKNTDPKIRENKASGLQERAFSFLNDLAERRNEVAHGISSDLLGHDILLEYLNLLNILGETIYDVVLQNLKQEEVRFIGSKIGKPTDIFKDGYVSCILSNNVQIRKDDYIVAQNDNELVSGRILGIQIDEVEVNEVNEESSIEIGLRTDCRIKKTHKISIISHEKKIL